MYTKSLKPLVLRLSIFGLLLFGGVQMTTMDAQCPMCRMSAESNLKNGGKAGRGLNSGILYMFSMPYLIIGGMAFWWYRNRKKEDSEELAEEVLKDTVRLN